MQSLDILEEDLLQEAEIFSKISEKSQPSLDIYTLRQQEVSMKSLRVKKSDIHLFQMVHQSEQVFSTTKQPVHLQLDFSPSKLAEIFSNIIQTIWENKVHGPSTLMLEIQQRVQTTFVTMTLKMLNLRHQNYERVYK